MLQEHVYLAGAATGAALGGRDDEFQAAAAALDANSVDISKAVGSVYGAEAENTFLPVWRSHIGFFVDYTQGAAANDQAKKDKAVADLNSYIDASSTFFSNANPNLPKQAVADLLSHHVMSLATVVDKQAAGDLNGAYMSARETAAHMDMIAVALSNAIAQQFPDQYPGPVADNASGNLQATLNSLFREHVYLAGAATGAALGGRNDEFQAAAAALDANSVDISKAVGSVYGAEAENTFLPVWRSHIGFFVDYTQGAAANDQAKKDKAVADLTSYIDASSTFFSNANPNLTKQAVTDLLSHHVMTLAAVVDKQAAGDLNGAYMAARETAAHMDMIASGLTAAIVKQFPELYSPPAAGGAATGMPGMPATGRGGELATRSYALYVVALGAVVTAATVGMLFRRRLLA